MKYRKKPIVVEAHQLTKHSLMEICRWMNSKCNWVEVGNHFNLQIPTLAGELNASFGDYIVKGIKGDFYPVKEDIFNETYEEIEE